MQPLSAAQARQLGEASRLLKAQRGDAALVIGRQLVVEAPAAPDAHHLLATCLATIGDAGEAEKAFLHALALTPHHPLIVSNYATLLRKAGRFDEALMIVRAALDASPASIGLWIDLGRTASAAGHRADAFSALRRAVELQPESTIAWQLLGREAHAIGDLDAAIDAFGRVVAVDPAHRDAWISLSTVLRLAGRPRDALACLRRLMADGGSSPELADAAVGALLDDGQSDEALRLANATVHAHPDFVAGLGTLAKLRWEYGAVQDTEDADAFRPFKDAIARKPDDGRLRAAFVRLLLSARLGEQALDEVRALRRLSDDPAAIWMEADALGMVGSVEQAGHLYARLHREWYGRDAAFLNAYVRHLLKVREWKTAAAIAGEAIRADPENQEAWAYLGTAWRLAADAREDWLCDYDRLVTMIEVDVPAEYESSAVFLDALRSTLNALHRARREPMQQSLRTGSQTPGRLFGGDDRVLAAARTSLLYAVSRWLPTLPEDQGHPFLSRNTGNVHIGGSWSVKLQSSGRHVNHIHPEGWMSSAFYVALPPVIAQSACDGTDAGYIQFGQPPVELGLDLPPRRVLKPEPGKLALFPSYLWHGTVPFEDTEPRLTIAFDMTPAAPSSPIGRQCP